MKIKNFQAVYPFEGYVTESVDCGSVAMQIKLKWDRRRCLRCPHCGEPRALETAVRERGRLRRHSGLARRLRQAAAMKGRKERTKEG